MNLNRAFALAMLALASCGRDPRVEPHETSSTRPFEEPPPYAAYYQGDGLGLNWMLNLLPGNRFTFMWQGCLGTYAAEQGPIRMEQGYLILEPGQPNAPGHLNERIVVVSWDDRRYLIPEGAMPEFCHAVLNEREPRDEIHGGFYLREGDHHKSATGLPTVPDSWRPFLVGAPINGALVRIESPRRGLLDIGSDDGIRAEMMLNSESGGWLVVTELEPGNARVKPWFDQDSIKGVGRVSTHPLAP